MDTQVLHPPTMLTSVLLVRCSTDGPLHLSVSLSTNSFWRAPREGNEESATADLHTLVAPASPHCMDVHAISGRAFKTSGCAAFGGDSSPQAQQGGSNRGAEEHAASRHHSRGSADDVEDDDLPDLEEAEGGHDEALANGVRRQEAGQQETSACQPYKRPKCVNSLDLDAICMPPCFL